MSCLVFSATPSVSSLNKDGTKFVTVLDPKNEVYKTLKVSADGADKYIKTRNENIDKANSIAGAWAAGLLAGCSIIGAIVGHCVKSLGKGEGLVLGLASGMFTCWLPWALKYNSEIASAKVTEQFIQENLEKEVVAE